MIKLTQLKKIYPGGPGGFRALDGIDLELPGGEFVAIVGKSGSGKSTLINLVAGIDRPTTGLVYVDETCVTRLSPRDRTLYRRDHMGFVFQFFNLIPTLTVLENVLLPAELGGDAAARSRAGQLLDRVGLADRRSSFPDRLSGGEQQRVAIARALVRDPRLVLADEPTGNLDDATGMAVMDLLDAMTRKAGKTLLLATHSREVAALANRVFTIEDGHLVAQATS